MPPIRRARGYHLYDLSGRRYLDLSLAGGRALLGHRPERALLEFKNLLSRGLAADLPSPFEHRLARALNALMPDHPIVRVYANEERLVSKLAPFAGGTTVIRDPVLDESTGQSAALCRWRPFSPSHSTGISPSIVVPVLPFPGSFAPAVACIRGIAEGDLPPSDPISPALLGAIVRSLYDLRALEGYSEARWSRLDAPWWDRRGPYLVARCEKREYSVLFGRLLEKGIYISPHFPGPSVVPAEFTRGEIEPLRRLAHDWPRD